MEKRKLKNWQLHLFNNDCKKIICKVDLPDGINFNDLAIHDLYDCVWAYPIFEPLEDKKEDKEYEKSALKIEKWVNKIMSSYTEDLMKERDENNYIEIDLPSVMEDQLLQNMNLTWEDWNSFDFIRNNSKYQECLLNEYINLFEKICYSRSVDKDFIRDFEWALQDILNISEQWKQCPYSDSVINKTKEILNIYWSSLK